MSHDTNTSTRKNKLVKDCSMKGEYRRTYSWPKQHFLLCVYVYEFVWNTSTFLCGSLLTGSTAEWDRGWQFPPSSLRDTFRHCVGWPAGGFFQPRPSLTFLCPVTKACGLAISNRVLPSSSGGQPTAVTIAVVFWRCRRLHYQPLVNVWPTSGIGFHSTTREQLYPYTSDTGLLLLHVWSQQWGE